MNIKEILKLRLEDINKLIELYKRRAIEELEKEKNGTSNKWCANAKRFKRTTVIDKADIRN